MILVKRELDAAGDADSSSITEHHSELHAADYQTPKGRRGIRSRYLAVKNMIHDGRDEIARPDSHKFDLIFSEMESLHQIAKMIPNVSPVLLTRFPLFLISKFCCSSRCFLLSHHITKPREQVADAKALLDITQSLVMSVRTIANGGLTPSDFVTHILKKFGGHGGPSNRTEDCSRNSVAWKDIGVAVSHVLRGGCGCYTMIGPMDAKIKQRKVINGRKRVRPAELARPEELGGGSGEERTETDKHMLTMFNILRTNKVVKLENLVLNRNSFAQTVENLFALSFLVRDGRAEIKVNEAGWQLVLPRNAPAANAVLSRDVSFSHFVFRFDFKDWKLMVRSVEVGEELMPHRNIQSQYQCAVSAESHETMPTTTENQTCPKTDGGASGL
ncbi:Non-structural maintenance of chromosomes element 4-like A, partial [Mucuna pruriens]